MAAAGIRNRAAVIVVALCALLSPAAGDAQKAVPASPFVERPETDLLLLAVNVDRHRVSDGLAAYGDERSVVLPLGEMTRVLGFAIEVDVTTGTADGFFVRESRRFHLSAPQRLVVVDGKESSFSPADVEVHQDDIYVQSRLFAKWFPLDVSVDFGAASVEVHPREPLPMQLAAERLQKVQTTMAALGFGGPQYPRLPARYELFGMPTADIHLQMNGGSGGRPNSTRYSVLANGDALGLESSFHLLGEGTEATDLRFELGRRSPDPDLLGPLNAREFGLGEVLFPGIDLIAQALSGPGLLISSFPPQQQNRFDTHSFIGELPVGWDVEIYRNGALLAFQQSRPDGRYEFSDVPLLFGVNTFRLIFYGPQGQKREEVQTFNIGDTLVPAGQLHYRVVANRPRGFGDRLIADAAYGLTDHLTLNVADAETRFSDRDHHYVKAGLQGYWRRAFLFGDVATDRASGGAYVRAGVQSDVGPVSVALYRARLNDFESEVIRPIGGSVRDRTSARVTGTLGEHSLHLPFTLEVIADEYASGGRTYSIGGSLASYVKGVALGNRLFGTIGRVHRQRIDDVLGSFLVSRTLGLLNVRGQYDYNVRPAFSTISAGLTLQDRHWTPYMLGLQISRYAYDSSTHYIASVARDQGLFGFGLNVDATSSKGVAVAVTVSSSLIRDPFARMWRPDARLAAASGAAAARVYLDANANGRFDAGETPIEGARFLVNRGSSSAVTGPKGEALLRGLAVHAPTDVSLAVSSLEDPLWVPAKEGMQIVPRPGKVMQLEFPVLITGEVTGTVYTRREGARREAGGVQLELVDAKGAVAKKTRTAFDGFFDISNIPPGSYDLRVLPEQAARLGLSGQVTRRVDIAASGTILDGVDFLLEQAQRPSDDIREQRRRNFEMLLESVPPPVEVNPRVPPQ